MKLSFHIDGQLHKIDLNEELRIDNLESDRSEVAAKIAYWGVILAAAEEKVDLHEAALEHWSGKATDKLMGVDGKGIAEWKVKPSIQAQDDFLKQKTVIAEAKSQAAKIRAVYNGFTRKHDLLRAMTGREVGEGRSAGDVGRESGTPDSRFDAFRRTRGKSTGE